MAPDHRRKTVRQRSGDGAQTERTAPRNIRRARDIPDRPLSGEGNRPKHSGTAFFERNLRAAVEPELHRPGGNTGYRNPRRRKPGKILRRSRRHARHGTESSDAAHGLCRYGSARRVRAGTHAGRDRQGLPLAASLYGAADGSRHRAGAIPGIPRGKGRFAGLDDRDVRRDEILHR